MTPKGTKRPIVLIERLELLTLPVWVWLAWRYRGGYCIGWARTLGSEWVRRLVTRLTGLRQLRYEEFPGTYFEVQRLVAESANDALYDAAREHEAAPIVAFLRRFRNHDFIEVALRKALQTVYTTDRVKALVLLRELSRAHGAAVFLPRDNRDPRPWVPASLGEAWSRAAIPQMARAANTVKSWVEPLAVAGFAALVTGRLAAKRGLVLAPRLRGHWRVGYDLFEEGIHWDKSYHEFFLYDDRDLDPQAVLHVVRNRLRDDRTRRYFEQHGIPYVEESRVSVPAGYFLRRVLRQFCGGTLRLAIGQLRRRSGPFLWAALAALLPLIRAEILEFSYTTDVFVGRDEYSVKHIIRTLVYDERGGMTVGFNHGDDPISQPSNSYQCCHAYCFPGEFHRELLKWNTRYCRSTCVIGAGLYGLDETYRRVQAGTLPGRYAKLRAHHRIVGAFASSFQEDFFITREMTLRFYRAVLRIPELYPDVVVVLRPKGTEFADPEFRRLVDEAGPRVILEEAIWTYDLLPVFDLMICIAASSVGLEGLMAGRRVIFFDEARFLDHPYERYDPMLVARSPDELMERVRRVLERDEYVDPNVLDHIRRYHGLTFDGRVVERFRRVIYAVLEQDRRLECPR